MLFRVTTPKVPNQPTKRIVDNSALRAATNLFFINYADTRKAGGLPFARLNFPVHRIRLLGLDSSPRPLTRVGRIVARPSYPERRDGLMLAGRQ